MDMMAGHQILPCYGHQMNFDENNECFHKWPKLSRHVAAGEVAAAHASRRCFGHC